MTLLKKIKIWIIVFLFGGVALAAVSLPDLPVEIPVDFVELESDILKTQTNHIKKNDRYLQIKKTVIGNSTYQVTEYLGPRGTGYQVIATKREGDNILKKSWGEGAEAIDRSYDWKIIKTIIASTTDEEIK